MRKPTERNAISESSLDVNASPVAGTKVQCAKIARAFKRLNWTNPGEQAIARAANAFVALGIAPEAKSSSWLARRLRDHATKFLGVEAAPKGEVAGAVVELQVDTATMASADPKVAKKSVKKSISKNE
jgi:hypothetical protein